VTATNAAGSATREYMIAVARGTSATAVSSSLNPSRLLQAVTFTAKIAATWSGTPDATGSAGTVKQVVQLPRR